MNMNMNKVEQIDIDELFNQARKAQKLYTPRKNGRNNRDENKNGTVDFSEAVDYFFNLMLNNLEKRVSNSSRNGKTSIILYTLDLEGYSWKKHCEESQALIDNENVDPHYSKHFYGVKMSNDYVRQISIKDTWFKHGLKERVENYFLQRDEAGNIVNDPSTGKPVRSANVFMKHTQKKHEDGSPIKGVWFFILDWNRQDNRKPSSEKYKRNDNNNETPPAPTSTPVSDDDEKYEKYNEITWDAITIATVTEALNKSWEN